MRNRAKCRLCGSIIESLHRYDYVKCKCGEIAISGGLDKLECFANAFDNFVRIDDEGKEVEVRFIGEERNGPFEEGESLSKEKKEEMIDAMIKYYEDLPAHAMTASPTHYDMKAIYLMMKQLLT
jgi:hypothetical protein